MSAESYPELDPLRKRLGPPLAAISRPGLEVRLHLDAVTQQLWLFEHRIDAHGEDWSAAPTQEAIVTSLTQGTLVVGGRMPVSVVHIEAIIGFQVHRLQPTTRGAWLTTFDAVELPFELVVRGLDRAASCLVEHALDFPADPRSGLRSRLGSTCRRLAVAVRARLGRLPRGTHSYP